MANMRIRKNVMIENSLKNWWTELCQVTARLQIFLPECSINKNVLPKISIECRLYSSTNNTSRVKTISHKFTYSHFKIMLVKSSGRLGSTVHQ